jgi:peroxiredoxin
MGGRTRVLGVGLIVALVGCLSIAAVGNQAPVARISAYRAGSTAGMAVTFNGATSTDPDGKIIRYQWLFGDGTTGSGATITHSYAQMGAFTVTLLVGDDGGATSLTTRIVDVASLPTQAGKPLDVTTTVGTPATSPALTGNKIGQRAPEIALPTLSGGMVHLSSYLGKTVLVEFWLSTCPGCQASMPQLEVYRSKYAEQGLVVMLVVLDRSASAATGVLQEYGYTGFVLAWESSASRPTMTAYGVSVTPTVFLVDPTGIIRYTGHPMGLSEESLSRWL